MNKVLLIILDGWGLSAAETGNAPFAAKTPALDYVYSTYPKVSLTASGQQVGLGPGEPGNSEVGHTNIGSGRIVWENLPRIDQSIEKGEFFKNENLNSILDETKKRGSTLHLIGLASNGGVHSHIRHLVALLKLASEKKIEKVCIHAITDGRDTAPKEAQKFFDIIDKTIKEVGVGHVATIIGRYFAMDRDKNWDREMKAYNLFVENNGDQYSSVTEAIEANYKNGKSDEFIEPAVIGDGGKVAENDAVIFFNHRSDRFRQIVSLFNGAEETTPPSNLLMATMTEYEKGQKPTVIFPTVVIENTLSEVIAKAGLRQFHTAETEKYAHVTYFLKAGKETILPKEDDEVVPSRKSPSYDQIPEMSAPKVTEEIIGAIEDEFDFVVANFANGDMVGHTGVMTAAVKACEEVDGCLAKILPVASVYQYRVLITADHGNCEKMIDDNGQPDKEHTANPVPLVYLDLQKTPYEPKTVDFKPGKYIEFANSQPIGMLASVAPTVLSIMSLPKVDEMDGVDLKSTLS